MSRDSSLMPTLKVVPLGRYGAGKTELITRLSGDSFNSSHHGPMWSPHRAILVAGEGSQRVILFDTEWQEKFGAITRALYRGASLLIFVFDVTDKQSFDDLQTTWIPEAERYETEGVVPAGASRLLVGAKIDAIDSAGRAVGIDEARQWGRDTGMEYVEVSSKTGEGIDDRLRPLMADAVLRARFCGVRRAGRGSVRLPVAQKVCVHSMESPHWLSSILPFTNVASRPN